ncbi:MAG: hypothetical protein U0929_16685 [Planctomycetaceae bacterium]
MDREEIEDLVYASLGRHLRVTCVLGLLFLGIGFVMGHLVAAQHTRVVSERWAAQAEQLSKQMTLVESKLKAELAKVRELSKTQSVAPPATPTAVVPEQEMTPPVIVTESRADAEATDVAKASTATAQQECREQVVRCIEETEREKVRIQTELQPFLDRKLKIEATEVLRAVNRLLENQVAHLKTLASGESPVVQTSDSPYFRPSTISPISGESTPARSASSVVAPLLPVPGDQAAASEDATLMPLPNSRVARVPVAAEPSQGDDRDALESSQPVQSKPVRRSIFLSSRKPVAVSSNAETTSR